MSADTKPTLVFVHGAWHSNECWGKLVSLLKAQGYECVTVGLASVDDAPKGTNWDDADKIREAVKILVDQGKYVIPVLHSAGGHPGSSAVAGLGLEERKSNGEEGGVIRIVCIAAILFPEDGVGPMNELLFRTPPRWILNSKADSCLPKDPENMFYNDMPEEDAKYWASKLRPTTVPPKQPKRAGWRTIPLSYLACENDNALSLELQLAMVEDVKKYGGKEVDVTTIQTGHSPFLSQPELVVDFIAKAVKA